MQSMADAVGSMVVSVLFLIAGPTVVMLMIRRFVPYLGERLWRLYCDVLVWLIRAPFRLIRVLVAQISRRT